MKRKKNEPKANEENMPQQKMRPRICTEGRKQPVDDSGRLYELISYSNGDSEASVKRWESVGTLESPLASCELFVRSI